MTGDKILVDTSIYVDICRGDTATKRKVDAFEEVFITPIVLAELYFGAYWSANPDKQLVKLNDALHNSVILRIDSATAETFVAIKLALYAKGLPIPENDMWIASAAIQHQLPLYTRDKHFKAIEGLVLN